MDFAEARTAFFAPRDNAVTHNLSTAPARRLRDALEPIAMVDLWSDAAGEQIAAAGLDFLTYYVGGRAGLLGDVRGRVAAAAFGVFEPGLVADLWAGARAIRSVPELLAAHERAATDAMRGALADTASPAEIDAVVDRLRLAFDEADPAGRPLFAGLLAAGWPEDPYARLWRAASLLREYRGDAHISACTLAGLTGLEANVLTELWVGYGLLEYTSTRGWSTGAMDAAVAHLTEGGLLAGGALTDEGLGLRAGIEDVTDRAVGQVVAALGDGVDTVVTAAGAWSDVIVARGWFPPDPYKRAAG